MDGASPAWEHFRHDADIGVRGRGESLAEAFANAALALSAIVVPLPSIRLLERVSIECAADDPEILLLDWLNAVIFEMATQGMLFGRFDVAIAGSALRAEAWGERVEPARHEPAVEPKGATLTELRVTREPDGPWRAQCVIDV